MIKFLRLYQQVLLEVGESHIYKPKVCFCQSQLLSRNVKLAIRSDSDTVSYVKRDNDFKISQMAAVRRLVNLLGVNECEAIDIASKHTQLCETTGVQLSHNYQTCLDKGLNKSTIKKCIDLLAIKDLPDRISYLRKLGNINDIAPLLRLPPLKLLKLQRDFTANKNIIYCLADLLKVPPFEMSEEFVNKPFLHRISYIKMSKVIELLMKNGITGQMIANDLTTFKYSLQTIEERIAFARECDITELKTWMIRADPNIFHNYLKIRSDNKEILGDKSVAEYLSQRMDCSLASANYLVNKMPALNNKSVKKMSEIIDYLYTQGFTPYQICRSPKILLHSFETTKKRMKKLTELSIDVNSLYILIKSQKEFQEFCDNSVKKRKKLVNS